MSVTFTEVPNYTLLFDGGKTAFEAYGSFAYDGGRDWKLGQNFLVVGHRLPVKASSHNVAEYQAMLLGMRFMLWFTETFRAGLVGEDGTFAWLEILGDSKVVINQMTDVYAANEEHTRNLKLQAQAEEAKLNRFFAKITYRHVPRSVCQSVFHH